MQVKVIDLDGSVISQSCFARAGRALPATPIDASDLAFRTRILARRRCVADFMRRVGPLPAKRPEIVFYGSGDFHHLTAALLARHDTPLTVIHFDNHPDWVRVPASFNCGSWVNRALELRQVAKVITIGPCSDDLDNPERKTANLEAIRTGRLELYPWRAVSSRVRGAYGVGPSHVQSDGNIVWCNLDSRNWADFLADLTRRIATRALYVTIDKDVLMPAEAVTNWDQGRMALSKIIEALGVFAAAFEIVGIDICGDYSAPRFRDPLRFLLAAFDHPRGLRPTQPELAVNAATNARLLACFDEVFA
jgi:hypothetical protein